MDENEIQSFYEKLYFHELDQRDKIQSRLQVPLGLIILFGGYIAYLIKSSIIVTNNLVSIVFLIFTGLAIIFLFIALYNFICALWGNTYELLPSANNNSEYLDNLLEYYKEYPGAQRQYAYKRFNEYLNRYFKECSSSNTIVNDYRADRIHKCISFIIFTFVFLIFSLIIYHLGGLDKNLVEKPVKIIIDKEIQLEQPIYLKGTIFDAGSIEPLEVIVKNPIYINSETESNMQDDNDNSRQEQEQSPPPLPPPPPKRLIREDVPIPKIGENNDD